MWPCTVASKSLIATDAPAFSMASPMLICGKPFGCANLPQPPGSRGSSQVLELTTRADGAHAIERELVGALQRTYAEDGAAYNSTDE